MAKKISDLELDGFTIYEEDERPSMDSIEDEESEDEEQEEHETKTETKIVVMDNKEVLAEVKKSNDMLKEGLTVLAKEMMQMQDSKPSEFYLEIDRDARGFMSGVKVRIVK